MVLRAFWLGRTGGGLWHMEVSRARRFKGSAIWKVGEPPFMPCGHGPERGDELYQLTYFLLGGALPLSRPEGLPVVPGQFPPCPG
ncbi:hypothetical protein CDT98_19160 [Cronobacter sakazakii]|nr:hypothetical protein CDT98_19160 [Cronobacter sakazakii]